MKGSFRDLTGQRFGRLTVTGRAPNRARHIYWLCRCDCGNEVTVRADGLTRGATTSCGCYHRDVVTKHGLWRSDAYGVWTGMVQRCVNPNHHAYHRYGGRGIKVCERWHDFEAFYCDMYPKPSRGHSLERIDNDGDYTPDNCRWATRKEQSRNRADNRLLTYKGETRCLTEWAEIIGMKKSALSERMRRGWNVQEAIEIPIDLGNRG